MPRSVRGSAHGSAALRAATLLRRWRRNRTVSWSLSSGALLRACSATAGASACRVSHRPRRRHGIRRTCRRGRSGANARDLLDHGAGRRASRPHCAGSVVQPIPTTSGPGGCRSQSPRYDDLRAGERPPARRSQPRRLLHPARLHLRTGQSRCGGHASLHPHRPTRGRHSHQPRLRHDRLLQRAAWHRDHRQGAARVPAPAPLQQPRSACFPGTDRTRPTRRPVPRGTTCTSRPLPVLAITRPPMRVTAPGHAAVRANTIARPFRSSRWWDAGWIVEGCTVGSGRCRALGWRR